MNTLHYTIYSAIGVIIGLTLPVILDGVERKIKAILQSRIGPPITQTLYDLIKLVNKEIKPIHTSPFILLYLLSFIATSIASIYMVETYVYTLESIYITLGLSLLAVSLTSLTLTPLLVPNPFSYAGGMREVILALINESAFILSTTLYAAITNNLVQLKSATTPSMLLSITTAALTMFISGYALTGRVPFDMAEAEPELASGVLVEFSGSLLAAYMYCNLLKRLLVNLIIVSVTVTPLIGESAYSLAAVYALTIVLWVILAITAVILGRSRIDLAPRTLTKTYILLLALSITGLLVHAYA